MSSRAIAILAVLVGVLLPTYRPSTSAAALAAVDADGLAPTLAIRKAFTLGASTDQAIYASSAPFGFRILDVSLFVSTAQALSTIELRSAASGGGSALSDTFVTTTTGELRLALKTATGTVATGGSLTVWRPSGGTGNVVGEIVITIAKE